MPRRSLGRKEVRALQDIICLEVEDLPGLETEVAIAGCPAQQEVGGLICAGIFAGIAVYVAA